MSRNVPQESGERPVQESPVPHKAAALDSTRAAPTRSANRGRALAIVSGLGALGGGTIGTLLLAALQTRAPGGFHWSIDIPFGLMFGGTFGAIVGAVGAPLLGWAFFRHVPLGRAIAVTSIGTIGGALIGLLTTGAPVIGGVLGFVLFGVALRLHPARRLT